MTVDHDLELSNNQWLVRVSPTDGGRISQITCTGTDLFVPDGNRSEGRELKWGCYPMLPWAGRLRNGHFTHDGVAHTVRVNETPHSLHGLAFDREWEVVSHDASSVVLRLEISDVAPFNALCEHEVRLCDDAVSTQLSVHSSTGTFPAMVGWHPWFTRSWIYDVAFGTILPRDRDNIVGASRYPASRAMSSEVWDDCFIDPLRTPRIRHGGLVVELESDCGFWMLYTEPTDSFCIEPMSGPPDSLDSVHPDRVVVTPDRPLVRTFTFRIVTGQK